MSRTKRNAGLLAAVALALQAWGAAGTALAIEPDEVLPDAKAEARARMIGKELRCLVCQNESIDDSDADLARDLRRLVRQRIMAGDSNAQVVQYIVARYGNYVLLKPPLIPETYLLWFGPLILALGAGGIAFVYLRGVQRVATEGPALTAEQDRHAAALLGETGAMDEDA